MALKVGTVLNLCITTVIRNNRITNRCKCLKTKHITLDNIIYIDSKQNNTYTCIRQFFVIMFIDKSTHKRLFDPCN